MTDEKRLLKGSLETESTSFTDGRRDTSGSSPTSSRHGLKRSRSCLSTRSEERLHTILFVACIVVVVGFFLPPVLIHIYQAEKDSVVSKKCLKESKSNSPTCKQLSWAVNASSGSSCSNYTGGSACKKFLLTWQDCAIGQQDVITVSVDRTLEKYVSTIIEFLDDGDSTSEECRNAGVPFLCQYVYHLCDSENSETSFLPSKEECDYVSTEACATEWKAFSSQLPKCNDLPNQTHPKNGTIFPSDNNVSNISNISCGDQFYEHNYTCLPRCDKFKQDSEVTNRWMQAIEIWTGWFGCISGLLVLVSSIIRYKAMFTFPSVFLVYMTMSYLAVVFLVVLTFFDQAQLYCSSKDLINSISNPTTFCTLSGVIFHYSLVNTTLWWFFHVSVIFYKLVFPFRAKRTEKYEKYIHLLLVISGLLLPMPAVIYTLVESKYILAQFPPLLCLPQNSNIFYYSTILLNNILIGTGVCMFIPMGWIIHKHRGSKYKKGKFSIAEKKIMFVFCYYALFGFITLYYFGITSWEQNDFIIGLKEYFKCKLFGDQRECSHCYRGFTNPEIKGVSYIVMSMIPLANLVFVINWKKVGVFWDHFKSRFKFKSTDGHEELEESHSVLSPHPESAQGNVPSTN